MSNRTLATQAEVQLLKDTLNQLAENLRAHADLSLGKAHGIELLSGFVDAFGNDLTTYQDSAGDTVADKFIAFAVNGVIYFAPGKTSSLAAQSSTVDALSDASAASTGTVGGTALITDYTSLEVQHAVNVNSLLLEHTLKPHAQAHLQTNAFLRTTADSAGHTVGRYVVQLTVGGVVYEFPADTRFGGPPQPPRTATIPPTGYVEIGEGAGNDVNFPIPCSVLGTKPFTFQFQWWDGLDWNDFAPGSGLLTAGTFPGWNNPSVGYTWASDTSNTLTIRSVFPGSDETNNVLIRCLVSNSAGSTTTNTLTFTARDNTGSWFVYATHACAPFTHSEMLRLYRLRLWCLKNFKEETSLYMGKTGRDLVGIMKAAGFDFGTLSSTVKGILSDKPYTERFAVFREMVVSGFEKFWPDCQHPVVVRALAARRSAASPSKLSSSVAGSDQAHSR